MLTEKVKKILRPLYKKILDEQRRPKRYHHLFDEIARIRASNILEVGAWNGNRAVQMIKKAQEHADSVHYVGFDLFEDLTDEIYNHELSKRPPAQKDVEAKLKQTGARVTLIKGNTLGTLPQYVKSAEKVDFVFIDGGHNVNTIESDWKAVSQLMHQNTVVIFDDYWRNRNDQSAKPVVDSIDQSKYKVEILPEIDSFKNTEFGDLDISFAKVTKLS